MTDVLTSPRPDHARRAARRAWLVLTAAGLVGVASLAPYVRTLLGGLGPEALGIPLAAAVALSLLQAAILTALLTALGVFAAPRVGFVSHVLGRARGEPPRPWRPELRAALLTATLVTGVAIVGEFAFLSVLGDDLRALWATTPRTLGLTLQGILYGGITEELMVRFGLLSGLVWLAWRVVLRRRGPPAPALVWSAVGATAVVFALAHLPALATLVPLDAAWVARSLLLNGAAAIGFGYVFVRHSLEAAMLAHATMHVLVSLIALATPLP